MPKTYINYRQQALENFLNDSVEKLTPRLFKWRGRYYEVLTYQETLKKHNWSQFVSLQGDWKMREASPEVIKKYYPKVTLDK
jgi:hypothetical protein